MILLLSPPNGATNYDLEFRVKRLLWTVIDWKGFVEEISARHTGKLGGIWLGRKATVN
jgi:hypothetical protein